MNEQENSTSKSVKKMKHNYQIKYQITRKPSVALQKLMPLDPRQIIYRNFQSMVPFSDLIKLL